MPTLVPDNTPSDIAYGSRQGQPAAVSPALVHQFSLSEFAALKTQLAAQAAEINTLKSQLAAQATQNTSPNSAIPQSAASSPQSEISNLKSEIPNPQSAIRNPQFPDPSSPAFAPLYAREVKHYLPGGDWIMPPMPAAALSRQAHIQRLNYLSTRCELALIERVDRFAVCGIVGPPEGETFAFIMHHLSRLTSIYKSITALENDPTIPVGPVAEDLTNLATSIMRDPTAQGSTETQSPSAFDSSPSPSSVNLQSANPQSDVPSVNDVNPVNPVNSVGSSLPHSKIPNLQSSICNLQSNNPQSKIRNPQSAAPAAPAVQSTPGVPVIRQVPQCPTYSPERLVRTLDQTATALNISSAGILPAHPSTVANSQTPSPTLGARTPSSANATFNESPSASPENAIPLGPRTSSSATPATVANTSTPSSIQSPSPSQSEILNLKSEIPDPPCPRANTPTAPGSPAAPRPQCTECDAELCPSRIAVPIFTGILKRTQKCDGACRFCSPKRQHTCPYTLPRFRASPKA